MKNQQEVVRGKHKPPNVDAVQSKTLAIREISNLKAIDIPLQHRPHPDSYKTNVYQMWQNTFSWETALLSKGGSVPQMFRERTLSVNVQKSKLAQVEALLEEKEFLETLEEQTRVTSNPLEVILTVNGVPVLFKIDTGADVSAISESVFHQLQETSLISSNHFLSGPSQYKLKVRGQFTGTLKYETTEVKENIFVVKSFRDHFWADQQ